MSLTRSLPAIDAVRRGLEIEDQGAQVRVTLRLTATYDLAPARLWPLLTRAEELARWFGPVQGDLREGGRFIAPGGAGGSILSVAEPHRIDLTWEYGENADPLSLRLDPEDDGTTELQLTHTLHLPREIFERFGPGAAAVGWDIALLGLAAATDGWRSACGEQVPMPTPQWLMSDEGATGVRAWCVRWAAAAIAAGVDEEIARRGEVETARAYSAAPADPVG